MRHEQLPEECAEYWDLLSAYVDGECDPEDARLVELHIAECASCARDLAFLRETSAFLYSLPLAEPDPALREAILRSTTRRPSWREEALRALSAALSPRRIALTGAAATVCVIAVLAWRMAPPAWQLHAGPNSISGTGPSAQPSPSVAAGLPARPEPTARVQAAPRTAETAHGTPRASVVKLAKNTPVPNLKTAQPARSQPSERAVQTPGGPGPTGTKSDAVEPMVPAPAPSVVPEPEPEPVESKPRFATGTLLVADAPAATGDREPPARLVTASATLSPGALSSLADLRRDLHRDQEAARARFEEGITASRPEVTVSLYKTRF